MNAVFRETLSQKVLQVFKEDKMLESVYASVPSVHLNAKR